MSSSTGHTGAADHREGDQPKHGEEDAALQLRESIARVRAEMGDTIEALHGRLNPTVLKEQALDQFHEAKEAIKTEIKAELHDAATSFKSEVKAEIGEVKSKIRDELQEAKAAIREATIGKVENMVQEAQETVREVRGSVVETIRGNPIPAALTGIGLAWLVVSARSHSSRRARAAVGDHVPPLNGHVSTPTHKSSDVLGDALRNVGGNAERAAQLAQRAAGRVAQQAGEFAHQAESSATAVTQAAGAVVGDFARQTQDAAVQLVQGIQREGMRLEGHVERTYKDNPLAVGAAMLAIGTAVGLAIPITRGEKDAIGPARDQLLGKAEDLAHRALDRAQDAAKHMTDDSSLGAGGVDRGLARQPRSPVASSR